MAQSYTSSGTETNNQEPKFELDSLKAYFRRIETYPLLTPEEERVYVLQNLQGDLEARTKLIQSNLRLVRKIAHDFKNLGLPLLDLIDEGNIGLMKAVERYDPAKGAKLSTYAGWWIKQKMRRALAQKGSTIRIPLMNRGMISEIRTKREELKRELGREPTDDELSLACKISNQRLNRLEHSATKGVVSLDASLEDEEGKESDFYEIIGEEDSDLQLARYGSMAQEVAELVPRFSERERDIVYRRYGFNGYSCQTLEEVGKAHGISGEAVRQAQERILLKLKRMIKQEARETERLLTSNPKSS